MSLCARVASSPDERTDAPWQTSDALIRLPPTRRAPAQGTPFLSAARSPHAPPPPTTPRHALPRHATAKPKPPPRRICEGGVEDCRARGGMVVRPKCTVLYGANNSDPSGLTVYTLKFCDEKLRDRSDKHHLEFILSYLMCVY